MPKVIEAKTNKNGIRYALTQDGETFGVYVLRENYASHCKGGMSQTWRYVEKGLSREQAEIIFNRRTK